MRQWILLFIMAILFVLHSPSISQQTIWPHPDSTTTGGWLQTVWHQQYPFNSRCPWDTVRRARSLAGCIAVAMAQLIHYHDDITRIKIFGDADNYTSTLNTFSFRIDRDCGSNNTLKWPELNQALSNLRFPLTSASDSGLVDELVYGAGVAVRTDYSADKSQAAEGKIPAALRSCFGFTAADQIFGSDSTILVNMQWCIKNALPVIAIITRSGETAHAVVVDGLNEMASGPKDDLYHINYGGLEPGETFWANLWPPAKFNNPINHGYNNIKSIIVSYAAPLPPPPPPPLPMPPAAKFSAVPTSGWPGLCVNFTNECSGAVSRWDWDYGDGSAHDTIPNPRHCFRSAGQYSVTLIAAGPAGRDTLTVVNMIIIHDTAFTDTGIEISIDADGIASWGDMDNDADPDLLVQYKGNVYLYRNDQTRITALTVIPSTLFSTVVQWIDLDRDNDLDLVLFSKTHEGVFQTQFYRNNNGCFSAADLYLPPLYCGAPAWGDYDNDGDPDLAAATDRNPGGLTLWQNTSAGFVKTNVIPLNYDQQGRWCDVDHDQDLDLLGNGETLYRNDHGCFTPEQLPWSSSFSMDVNDYDHDGDLDFLSSGATAASIYQNTTDICKAVAAIVTDIRQGNSVWFDYDLDGLDDILLAGRHSDYTKYVTRLYHGKKSEFIQIVTTPLNGAPARGVAVADYDQDGDPDILTLGDNGSGDTVGRLFMNNSVIKAEFPAAPQHLRAEVTGHTAALSWSAASSPLGTALTYNLAVGTSTGSGDILSPQSLRSSGKRLIPAAGNVWNNTQWLLRLPAGDYYWTVQSIDINHNGSPFAAEMHFVIPPSVEPAIAPDSPHAEKNADSITLTWTSSRPEEVYRYHLYKTEDNLENKIAELDGSMRFYSDLHISQGHTYQYYLKAENWSYLLSAPSATVTVDYFLPFTFMNTNIPCPQNFFQIADMDNDGDLDIVLDYQKNGSSIHAIFSNNLGRYTEKPLDDRGSWSNRITRLYDFDNDNDLDFMTFFLYTNANLCFLRNEPANFAQFFYEIPLLSGLYNGYEISLLDMDNDGRQDILVSGVNAAMTCTSQMINNTLNGYQAAQATGIADYYGDFIYCDYDQDGDQDILFRGLTGRTDYTSRQRVIRLFNNHRGRFSAVDSSLLGGSVAQAAGVPFWQDCDLDTDSDICITQDDRTTVYYNDQGRFTRSGSSSARAHLTADGDLDNDGLRDLIQYENDHYGIYLQTDSGLQKIFAFSTAAGMNPCYCDYDVDGDLDILLTYHDGAGALLRNETEKRKNPPSPPVELTAVAGKDSVLLRWQQPSDPTLRCSEISYNLRVGLSPGGCEIVSPLADINTGQRRLLAQGNMLSGKSFKLYGLAAGVYYWSVQTIDAGFSGSVFSREQSFTVSPASAIASLEKMPAPFALWQNHPNPFTGQTDICFELPTRMRVHLTVFNLKGQIIAVLKDEELPAGRHVCKWNGMTNENKPAASGVYMYQLKAGSFTGMRKLIVFH